MFLHFISNFVMKFNKFDIFEEDKFWTCCMHTTK